MAKKKSFKDRLEKGLSTISSQTFNLGFSRETRHANTGNYALNRRLSNNFHKGYLLGKSVILGGEPGSGKSLHAAYTCAQAQKDLGALIVWIDIEKATSEEWLVRCGVDIENLVFMRAATVSDCKEVMAQMTGMVRAAVKAEEEDIQPIIIVVDSYSALMTDSAMKQAANGENVGDQGQKAKQIGSLIESATHLTDGIPVLIIGMVHIYYDQSGYGEREKLTAGIKAQFMASYICKLNKSKLKAEELGQGKNAEEKKKVVGITSKFTLQKSRFSKPFEEIEISIPWDTGMDPYAGLFDVMQQEGVIFTPLNPEGKASTGWYSYRLADGTQAKNFRKGDFVKDGHADLLLALAPEEPGRGEIVGDTDETPVVIEVEM